MAITRAASLTEQDSRTGEDSAIAIAIQDDCDTAMPVGRNLSIASNPEVESEPLVFVYGASTATIASAYCKPGVSHNTDQHMASYQNSTREKEEEKWSEKDDARIAVENDRDASMMILGMETQVFVQDLVGTSKKEAKGQMARIVRVDPEGTMAMTGHADPVVNVRSNNQGTTEEPEGSGGAHSSIDIAIDGIRNPSVLPIRTASKWDPGPSISAYVIPAIGNGNALHELAFGDTLAVECHRAEMDVQNPQVIVVRTMPRGPVHPVSEFPWPPEAQINWTYRALIRSISTRNDSFFPWSPTTCAAGICFTSSRNGGIISDNQRKSTQVIAETGTGHCADNTMAYALYIGKIGRALRGEIRGRKVWDPGGRRAKALFTVGRARERREKWAG